MPNLKMVITISEQVQRAIPLVARDMGLHSDAVTPDNVESLLEVLVIDHALRLQTSSDNDSGVLDTEAVLQRVLDPNIGGVVQLRPMPDGQRVKTLTMLEHFDELAKAPDPWIDAVKATVDDLDIWKAALVTVYQTITGPDRKEWNTWVLIERTFRMLKQKTLDKPSQRADNPKT